MPGAKKSYHEIIGKIEKNVFPILLLSLIVLYFLAKKYLAVIFPGSSMEFSDLDLLFGALFFSVVFITDKTFRVGFKPRHYIFMALITALSFVLIPLYSEFFYYDKIIHFTQSIFLSSIIFYMIRKLNIKLKWALLFTVFIMIGIGSIWEIGEFGADKFFNLNTQGVFLKSLQGRGARLQQALDPLSDTDLDMFFNILGSLSYPLLFLGEEYFSRKKIDMGQLLNRRGMK